MKIYLHNPIHFEPWDYRTPDTTGIGGSETCTIEMAWRLARRGHEVTVFAPCEASEWRGTHWLPIKAADVTSPGLHIVMRSPVVADSFHPLHDQQLWLMCQDVDYRKDKDKFTEARVAKFDRIMPLCQTHAHYFQSTYPYIGDKLCVSTNGIRLDLIRRIEAENITRNPKKLVYASSPDRGLIPLLKIFRRAREYDPELELVCYYGWQNMDKIIADHPKSAWARTKREVEAIIDQPGVTWKGRINQPDLIREWFSAGMFVYPTNFQETNCISVQEAQACGAIPIVSPVWALAEKTLAGIIIPGDADDALTHARFVDAIVRVAANPGQQEVMRKTMMPTARRLFNWERVADQWEAWINGSNPCQWIAQFAFQHKHSRGRILNVGCDADLSDFAGRGAINLDVVETSPVTKARNKAHVLADARNPLPFGQEFDSVVCGEILEHMTWDDGIATLKNAAAVLKEDGNVVVTVPDDPAREFWEQHKGEDLDGMEQYAPGVSAYHHKSISKDDIVRQVEEAGLHVDLVQEIDYSCMMGWGVVAHKNGRVPCQ